MLSKNFGLADVFDNPCDQTKPVTCQIEHQRFPCSKEIIDVPLLNSFRGKSLYSLIVTILFERETFYRRGKKLIPPPFWMMSLLPYE